MFCPECRSLVHPKDGEIICDNCGYEGEAGPSQKVQRKSEGEDIPVLKGGTLETMPKTEEMCPECGHGEAHYVIQQTRAADEPETMIYTCPECKHRWREYS